MSRGLLAALALWGATACVARQQPPAATPAFGSGDAVRVSRGHYLEAVWHWDRGECDLADAAFARALLFDPGSPWLNLDRGRAQLDCGRVVEAEANLRAAGIAGAGSAWGYLAELATVEGRIDDVALAVEYWALADVPLQELSRRGRWRVLTGDLEGGLEDLVVGLPESPSDIEGVELMLRAATSFQRLQTAFVVLSRLHDLRPRDRQVLRWLGDLAAEFGDEATALNCYRALDDLTGASDPAVWQDLARVALRTRDRTLAEEMLARGATDRSLEAGLLGLVGRVSQAEQVLDAAQAVAPLDRSLALRRAEVRFAAGDLDGALDAVTATKGLSPEARARLQAQYLARSGEHAAALALLDPHGDQLGAARLRVRLMLELGREADALTAAEVGLERWPGDRRLESRRVIALDALDRQDQALAAARALLRVNPGDVDAALVLVRRAEPADAVQAALWTCIEANPGEPDLWLEFAMSHWIQGSQERAAPAARRAGQLLGRDIEPGERYARMCAELPCRGEHTEERR